MAKEQKWMKVERLVHVDWNPRTPEELKWDHLEMVPLIASVKSVGVVQPIAVWADKAAIEHCDYEAAKHPIDGVVIAGNRRLEAARAAGLKEIPALVFTDISSAQAQEITRLENEVRLGVDPLKDASLIGSMLGLGYSQKEIAAHFGVSEARICRRRKLLDLVPAIRELAEKSGKLTVDALERIALYPKDIQERCAKEVVTRVGRGSSDSQIKWRDISWKFAGETQDLEDAQFDTSPCKSCPKRTGAQPDLWGDTADDGDGLGVCLDAKCYRERCEAWAMEKLRKKVGKRVELIPGAKNGIAYPYNAPDSIFVFEDQKPDKKHPACWYWIDEYDGELSYRFGPTVEDYTAEMQRRKEEAEEVANATKEKQAKIKAEEARKAKLQKELDGLEAAAGDLEYKIAQKVSVAVRGGKSEADMVKFVESKLLNVVGFPKPQRLALAKFIALYLDDSCDDTDAAIADICDAFPKFATACKVTKKELSERAAARLAVETFKMKNNIKD